MPANGPRPKPSVPAAPAEPKADFQFIEPMRHVALAVSGGADSLALMRLAATWAGLRTGPLQLSVLTVDHGLRAGSEAEAAQVAQWASTSGLDHHILVWTGPKPTTGLQAKAREARYGLMAAWCKANGADALLTAHSLDDQAETVLMRLERTLSPASLAGIPVLGQWAGVPLLRPLLSCGRADLRTYLKGLGQPWIDDPSNTDRRFERVRARQQLADMAPGEMMVDRLARLGRASAEADRMLQQCSDQWLKLWLSEDDAGVCFAPLAEFINLPQALQQRILARILTHYGGGRLKPETAELARLCHWLANGGPPRRTLAGAVVGRRKTSFWVTREASRIDPVPVTIRDGAPILWDGRFLVEAPNGATVGPAGEAAAPLNARVPVHARRAYPLITLPETVGDTAKVSFLRLASP